MSELVRTEDGSITRYHQQTGELYHNRAGAFTEALRNYFQPSGALEMFKQKGELRLLDACFGLGYNSFVLLEQLLSSGLPGVVSVSAVEIDPEILLTVPHVLRDDRFVHLRRLFGAQQPSSFGRYDWAAENVAVSMDLVHADLRSFASAGMAEFDLVFHDPFSPRKVPELWSTELFAKYYQALRVRQGRLLTYSVAAAVRAGLKQAGFRLYRTIAVGGKSGGTLADAGDGDPLSETVFSLTDEEVKRLQGGSGVPYRDPEFALTAADILSNRAREQASR